MSSNKNFSRNTDLLLQWILKTCKAIALAGCHCWTHRSHLSLGGTQRKLHKAWTFEYFFDLPPSPLPCYFLPICKYSNIKYKTTTTTNIWQFPPNRLFPQESQAKQHWSTDQASTRPPYHCCQVWGHSLLTRSSHETRSARCTSFFTWTILRLKGAWNVIEYN